MQGLEDRAHDEINIHFVWSIEIAFQQYYVGKMDVLN